jgi:hypothetical protein
MMRFIDATTSFSSGRKRGGFGREVHHDAHVGGDGAVLGCEHRVQVQLGDLGEVAHQLAHAHDDGGEGFAVDRVAAAHALEHLGGLDAVEHGLGVLLRGGGQAEGDVLEHFDQHAAQAEGHQLAEAVVGDGADDHLGAALDHLLHLHADDLGVGLVLLGVGDDGVVGLGGLVGALDADDHAARFGLVQDVRRDDLHHHREAHGAGQLGGLGRAGDHAFLGHRDAVGIADQLAFGRGERVTPFLLDRVEDLADLGLVALGVGHAGSLKIGGGARRAPLDDLGFAQRRDFFAAVAQLRRALPRCARPAAASASPRWGCRTA